MTNRRELFAGTVGITAAVGVLGRAVSPALAALPGAEVTPATLDNIVAAGAEVYGRAYSAQNTALIRVALEAALSDPYVTAASSEAWALLAQVRCCDYLNRWNNAGARDLVHADHAVLRSLQIDQNNERGCYVHAMLRRCHGDHQTAYKGFQRVTAMNPKNGEAWAQLGNEAAHLGRPEETPELINKAISLTEPGRLALGIYYWINGRAFFMRAQYSPAASWLANSVNSRGDFWYNRAWFIGALVHSDHLAQAKEQLGKFSALFPAMSSLGRIIDAEQYNPNTHPMMIAARTRVHEGLVQAGLPGEVDPPTAQVRQ